MQTSDLKLNTIYTAGRNNREIVEFFDWFGIPKLNFKLLSGKKPEGSAVRMQGGFKVFALSCEDFAKWAVSEASVETVSRLNLPKATMNGEQDLILGQNYWNGGDSLRKLTGLLFDEDTGKIIVRFKQLHGKAGRDPDEIDQNGAGVYYCRMADFRRSAKYLAGFGPEALEKTSPKGK
jgi:hypothetical protein